MTPWRFHPSPAVRVLMGHRLLVQLLLGPALFLVGFLAVGALG